MIHTIATLGHDGNADCPCKKKGVLPHCAHCRQFGTVPPQMLSKQDCNAHCPCKKRASCRTAQRCRQFGTVRPQIRITPKCCLIKSINSMMTKLTLRSAGGATARCLDYKERTQLYRPGGWRDNTSLCVAPTPHH